MQILKERKEIAGTATLAQIMKTRTGLCQEILVAESDNMTSAVMRNL
jgi:hypothetical protein